MCVIQIFLLENIFKSQNKLIQIGKIIVIIASIILFIDSILNSESENYFVSDSFCLNTFSW